MPERTNFNEWEKLESRGKGGQGEVFRTRKACPKAVVSIERVMQAIRDCAAYTYADTRRTAAEEFISLVREIASGDLVQNHAQIGALKLLHPIDDQRAAEKAKARMAREL